MTKHDDAAFPVSTIDNFTNYGMTLQQYAAITLKVPNSGTDWLDEMIATSLRDDMAKAALIGPIADLTGTAEDHAFIAYEYATAMMEVR